MRDSLFKSKDDKYFVSDNKGSWKSSRSRCTAGKNSTLSNAVNTIAFLIMRYSRSAKPIGCNDFVDDVQISDGTYRSIGE